MSRGYQMESLNETPQLAGNQTPGMETSSTSGPNDVSRMEAGCCGCRTKEGACNGGFEKINRSNLSFNPETRFEGVTKAYLDVHSGGDFFYFSSCIAVGKPYSFKVLIPSKNQDTYMEHLYSINNHLKCPCSCEECCFGLGCPFGFSYECCDYKRSQLDYTFLGKTFATMGQYIPKGCYNDCCSCICGCSRERNINLVRLNMNSNDIDSTKGENVGLLYVPGCCQNNKCVYEYHGSKRYRTEITNCCPLLWMKRCWCCSGKLEINIIDECGDQVVGNAIFRVGVYGTKYNEQGEEDTTYMMGGSTVDDTRKNCCVAPVNPHFVINFPKNATSIDKFNIINQIAYQYYYIVSKADLCCNCC